MRQATGFTLLEVLLAMVILALGLTAVILALQANTSHISYAEDKVVASWVAGNVLADLQTGLATNQGESLMLNKTWYWQIQQQSTAVPQVKQLEITVGLASKPLLTWTSFIA